MLKKGVAELRKLRCRWVYGHRLSTYLDHELSDFEARTTANHLNECPRCQAELEQLQFANRALAEFEIPLMSSQLLGNVLRLPQVKEVSRLKRLARHKIAVPLPLAAGLLICLISVSLLALFGRQRTLGQSATSAPSPPAVIKIVEVPRDRVFTRTVYVKQPVSRRVQISQRINMNPSISPHAKENIAQNNSKATEWPNDVLKGFRPAVNANFRVVKGHEK